MVQGDCVKTKMTDGTEEQGGKAGQPSKLLLRRTVGGGQVKQNFAHGKSKTVTVEVRKTRTFSRESGKLVEVRHEAHPTQAEEEIRESKILTEDEKTARLEALKTAIKEQKPAKPVYEPEEEEEQAEPEAVAETGIPAPVQETPPSAPKRGAKKPSSQPAAKEVPQEEEKTIKYSRVKKEPEAKAAPGQAKQGAAAAPAQPQEKLVLSAKLKEKSKAIDWEERGFPEKAAKKSAFEKRNTGKLTVTKALDQEDQRTRSLASIKRAREKAARKALGYADQSGEKIIREVVIPETITVGDLANRMAVRVADVIRELMKLGVMATINHTIDADTAELIVTEFGHKSKRVTDSDVENVLQTDDDEPGTLQPRPPVVTIMGHVDHGKTSLLDALRESDVAGGEAGGITQHIGAYQVNFKGKDSGVQGKITFIDTPGHAAFTEMRARGAKVTDIVILVVAADDGIMEQTVEAINHAKAAGVPIIVAINKIDKPEANPLRVKNELLTHGLVAEDMGGDTMVVEVSAKQRIGLDKLEETILLQAEVEELKANPDRPAAGTVIEAKVDKGRGAVATVIVEKGTLRVGDIIVAGTASGKVRALHDHNGKQIKEAPPSTPVEVLGLGEAPRAGDEFSAVENEKQARDIAEYRKDRQWSLRAATDSKSALDRLMQGPDKGKLLPVIIKGDVHGSIEAIAGSVSKLSTPEIAVKVIHSAVGGITESDIALAKASRAMIVAFNVRPTAQAKEMAKEEKIDIRYYSIIYDVVDDMRKAMSGLLDPVFREEFLGYAEIRKIFNVSKEGKVAGCYVTEGVVKRGASVRLLRDNVVIHQGKLKTLRRFKDDVKEVASGYECGMAFENYEDIREGDMIEAYELIQEKQQLLSTQAS